MAEVSTERGKNTRFIGDLEGTVLPQAEKKGISGMGQDDKQTQVSSEWTDVAEGVWDGGVTRDSAGHSQTQKPFKRKASVIL